MGADPSEFEQRGRHGFWYRIGKPRSKPYEWRDCEQCGARTLVQHTTEPGKGRFCSTSCWANSRTDFPRRGADSYRWAGDGVGYASLHKRVYAVRGPALECVWACKSERYEWANLTGDYADIWDYAAMCVPCHRRYDSAVGVMLKGGRDWRPWRYVRGAQERGCFMRDVPDADVQARIAQERDAPLVAAEDGTADEGELDWLRFYGLWG